MSKEYEEFKSIKLSKTGRIYIHSDFDFFSRIWKVLTEKPYPNIQINTDTLIDIIKETLKIIDLDNCKINDLNSFQNETKRVRERFAKICKNEITYISHLSDRDLNNIILTLKMDILKHS